MLALLADPLQDDAQRKHEDEDEKDEESHVECCDSGADWEKGRRGTVTQMC